MEFEYDRRKSAANEAKHGIDFEAAQLLWEGSLLELRSKFPDEPRKLVIGRIEERFWTAVITERVNRIRIISVRRSRANEEKLYKANEKDNR